MDDHLRKAQFTAIGGLIGGFLFFAYWSIEGFFIGALIGAIAGLAAANLTD